MRIPKKYTCLECNKTYCYMVCAIKHDVNRHDSTAKFRKEDDKWIMEEKLK